MQGTRPKEQQVLPAESRCGVKTGAVCCLNTSLVSTLPEYSRGWRQSTLRRIPLKYNVGWYRVERTPLFVAYTTDGGALLFSVSALQTDMSMNIRVVSRRRRPCSRLYAGDRGVFCLFIFLRLTDSMEVPAKQRTFSPARFM